jgi:hypothetical protein
MEATFVSLPISAEQSQFEDRTARSRAGDYACGMRIRAAAPSAESFATGQCTPQAARVSTSFATGQAIAQRTTARLGDFARGQRLVHRPRPPRESTLRPGRTPDTARTA